MRGLPQKQNARRADKIRLCGHLRRYKKIVKKTYIILENCYNNDVSLKDAGKTLAGIRLISACFIIVQKENKGRN